MYIYFSLLGSECGSVFCLLVDTRKERDAEYESEHEFLERA